MKDLCAICGKPFPANTTRFLHFIGHIQQGEAVGRFDDKGNWRFEKTETKTETARFIDPDPMAEIRRYQEAAAKA